jgi:hypothetical protein
MTRRTPPQRKLAEPAMPNSLHWQNLTPDLRMRTECPSGSGRLPELDRQRERRVVDVDLTRQQSEPVKQIGRALLIRQK